MVQIDTINEDGDGMKNVNMLYSSLQGEREYYLIMIESLLTPLGETNRTFDYFL